MKSEKINNNTVVRERAIINAIKVKSVRPMSSIHAVRSIKRKFSIPAQRIKTSN